MTKVFVFDVESIGLHGEGFAVGGGLYTLRGFPIFEFLYACPPEAAQGAEDNRKWVKENVPEITCSPMSLCTLPIHVRDGFWEHYQIAKWFKAGIFCECGWPVEANFLRQCILDDPEKREFEGPYPLHDVASFMELKGTDPMFKYPRLQSELPEHNPLNDARQSMRLLLTSIGSYDVELANA